MWSKFSVWFDLKLILIVHIQISKNIESGLEKMKSILLQSIKSEIKLEMMSSWKRKSDFHECQWTNSLRILIKRGLAPSLFFLSRQKRYYLPCITSLFLLSHYIWHVGPFPLEEILHCLKSIVNVLYTNY